MNIGIMRNNSEPTYLSKLIAVYSKAFGINVLYIRPKDVNIETGTVNAQEFNKGKWEEVQTELPAFIDISQFCFKKENRDIIKYLRANTYLSDNGLNRNNKIKFIEKLKKDPKLNYLLIPTDRVEDLETIKAFSMKYNKMILKPTSGQFGNDIYFLSRDKKNQYLLQHGRESSKLSKKELENFFNEILTNKKYIVQKYIESKTKQGHPFDCRINVEKDGQGQWTVAKMFFRIGIGQKVVSNISQGGAVATLNNFLKANYPPEQIKSIKESLNKIAKSIPLKVEEIRKQELITLGIDVGIDKDGSVYLFEVNGAPGTSQLRETVAELRAQYYKYIIEKLNSTRNGETII